MCICGHGHDEHQNEYGECEHEGCLCACYEEDDEDDERGGER
jgi:hypothetical protein